ncbi:MAG: hypothetical protein AB8H80_22985 [Planctomycetota bacterium]
MLDIKLGDLTVHGWLLAIVSMAAGVLLCIPLGAWALEAIDRGILRQWIKLLCPVLAAPAIGVAILSFRIGSRMLQRAGIRTHKRQES